MLLDGCFIIQLLLQLEDGVEMNEPIYGNKWLCRGITLDFNGSLAEVSEVVIQHTQKRWPKWLAKLVHDYFSNPWAILSLMAAIVILILTFLQTYFAIFTHFVKPPTKS